MDNPYHLPVPTASPRFNPIQAIKISIDASDVDILIERLEKAVAAFKAEWNRK